MAFLYTHFAKVSTKTALVNPKLIHLMFALTATTAMMTDHLKPLALHYWSTKENLPLLQAGEVAAQQQVRVGPERLVRGSKISNTVIANPGNQGAAIQKINNQYISIQDTPSQFSLPSFSFTQGASTHFMSSHNNLPPKQPMTSGVYKDTRKDERKEESDTVSPETHAPAPSFTSTPRPIRTAFKQEEIKDAIGAAPLPPSPTPPAVVIVPTPQPQPEPQLPYKYTSKAPLLRYWMQMISGGQETSNDPFSNALLQTLLSPKYQPFVNDGWFDDEEDEPFVRLAAKQRRNEFFYDFAKSVEWDKTPFERLFIVGGSTDMHHVNEDAFDYVYEFPETLGRGKPLPNMRMYSYSDIDCKEELLT